MISGIFDLFEMKAYTLYIQHLESRHQQLLSLLRKTSILSQFTEIFFSEWHREITAFVYSFQFIHCGITFK